MMLYFAHPIDNAGLAETVGYRSMSRNLRKAFDWVFDPSFAFQASGEPEFDGRVQAINFEAMARADAVFACLPRNASTVGTVAEIIRAANIGQTVMVYHEGPRPIGLGEMPPNVEFWPANAVSSIRHEDVEAAARELRKTAETVTAMYPPELVHTANGAQRNTVPDLLAYYGPLQAERKYDGDAAWDLPAAETVTLEHGERCRVRTGVYVAPPPDVWFSMQGRSSMFERGLFVEAGVIDSGWRGELEAKVYNLSNGPVVIEAGERIAQLIPHRVVAQQLQPYDVGYLQVLPYGDRGTNGWGSTGR